MKVLVVEDEFIVRLDAASQFEDEGFDVTSTGSADDALLMLPDAFDVLFTDVNMPGKIDGLQLAHQVRRLWPDVRLIITSGRTVNGCDMPQGAVFFAKPYRIEQVADMIRR